MEPGIISLRSASHARMVRCILKNLKDLNAPPEDHLLAACPTEALQRTPTPQNPGHAICLHQRRTRGKQNQSSTTHQKPPTEPLPHLQQVGARGECEALRREIISGSNILLEPEIISGNRTQNFRNRARGPKKFKNAKRGAPCVDRTRGLTLTKRTLCH